MKILWIGDAVVSSGFARCTHIVCDHLHAAGHEVHVLGINYWGDSQQPYQYPIYAPIQPLDHGNDQYGVTRLPCLASRLQPDVIVILQDPWNIPAYTQVLERHKITCPVIGWIAVDAKNQIGDDLNKLNHVIVWTQFAKSELEHGGCKVPISIVPLGVDTNIYYPRDRNYSRQVVTNSKIPSDKFVFGVVGRNQPRKRLDLTLQYFSEWIHKLNIQDAYLHLHIGPTGDKGCNLRSLIKYYNLLGRVLLAEPDIGIGIPGSVMPHVYSSFDCYITTTQGEGWGLPCLEAMACGVPCIVPDWSGLGSWTGDAAMKILCDSVAPNAPLNDQAHTLGGIPNKDEFIRALDDMYWIPEVRDRHSKRGLELSKILTWQKCATEFERTLLSLLEPKPEVAEAIDSVEITPCL